MSYKTIAERTLDAIPINSHQLLAWLENNWHYELAYDCVYTGFGMHDPVYKLTSAQLELLAYFHQQRTCLPDLQVQVGANVLKSHIEKMITELTNGLNSLSRTEKIEKLNEAT